MNRLLRAFKWLWGTSWPLYAASVLAANLIGALAVMAFIRFLIPMPEVRSFTAEVSHVEVIGMTYLAFAVIVAVIATLMLFRPVLA